MRNSVFKERSFKDSSMHNNQGKIFRKTKEELIEDDWMKFQGLNMRKEESFQYEAENLAANKPGNEYTQNGINGKSSMLKPNQDMTNNPSNIVSFSGYYEEIHSAKNIMNPDEILIQTPNNVDSNNYRFDDKLPPSQQQLQQPSLSAGLSRKRQNRITQYNKPSLNLIGSTSAVENHGKDHNHSNSGNMRLFNQKNFNLIMNIRKKIYNFINYYTLFGRNSFLQNEVVRKAIDDRSDSGIGKTDVNYRCLGFYRLFSSIKRFKCFRFLKRLKFEPFNPHTTFHLIWQMYITLYNYLFFIVLSFLIVFSAGVNNESVENIYFAITSCQWILEILIKTNTSIYVKTKFINNRSEIMRIYLKKRFFFDIVPLVLILTRQLSSSNLAYVAFRIPLFLKFVNCTRDSREAEKQLLMNLKHFYIVQLINLVVNLFLVGHVISCLWYLMHLIQRDLMDSSQSWFAEGIGQDGVWWKIYLQAFYWSFTLMATGSNEATTTLEVFFTSVIMLFTTIVFGYMVNTIGVILSEMNKLEEEQRRDINLINKYMKRKQISKKLQHRINLDLEQFYLRSTKNKSEEETSVLTKISTDLSEEIKLEYNKNILSKIPFLVKNFGKETIDKLCLSVEEVFYSPNQIIFNEQESNEFSLIIIISGQVQGQVHHSDKKIEDHENEEENKTNNHLELSKKSQNQDPYTILQTLKKGNTIGEVNFFTESLREFTAKSRTFTTILKIERSTFLSIIENSPKDFEKYCEMRDKLKFYNNYKIISKACKLCQSSNHTESFCNQAHFIKNSPFFFSRINRVWIQERNYERKRRQSKSDNSYIIRSTAVSCIETLRQQYDLVEENKKRSITSEHIINQAIMTVDYENDDDEYQKYKDEEDDYDQEGNFSPGVSPGMFREESIVIGSTSGHGFSSSTANNMQQQQLYMIPEENTRQKSSESSSDIPQFQNVNSMLYLGYGSSNNVEQGYQSVQRKQSIRYQSNGFLNQSTSQNNSNANTALPLTNREDFFNKDSPDKDYSEETSKQSFAGRESYIIQQFKENENHRKTIILTGSPRGNNRMRSMISKRQTQQFNDGQMNSSLVNQSQNNNQYNNIVAQQQRRFGVLTIQTGQNGVNNSGERTAKQIDRPGDRLNSYFKTDNWNERIIPLEEKNKNDFLFEFDSLKLFTNYFNEGNANTMIGKWNYQRKKYLKKYASGEAKGIRNNRTAPSIKCKSQNIPLSPNQLNGSSSVFDKK